MASTIPGIRLVRCPKCTKILTEYSNVPVYQCAECGTTLQAKYYNAIRQNIVATPLDNKPENLPNSGSLDNGLPSKIEVIACASENRVHSVSSSILQSSNLDVDCSLNEVEKSSNLQGHESSKLSERMHNSAETPCLEAESLEGSEANKTNHDGHGNILRPSTTNSNANDGSVSSASNGCNDDTPQKRIPMSRRTFRQRKDQDLPDITMAQKGEGVGRLTTGTQAQAEEISQEPSNEESVVIDRFDSNASSEDSETNRSYPDGHGNILQPTTTNSNANDGTSSANDGCNGDAPLKRIPTSRRTFRQRKVQDLPDTTNAQGQEVNKTATGTQVQAQEVSREPSNEESVKDDSRHRVRSHVGQDTSLDSEDFHSVQNWMEPDSDGPLKSLSKEAEFLKDSTNKQNDSPTTELNSLEHIQLEIVKRVDELRVEINEIFNKSDQGKGRSHLRLIQEEGHDAKHLDSDLVRLPPKAHKQRKDVPRQHRFYDIPSGFPSIPRMRCHHEECKTSVKPPAQSCCHNGICRACHRDMSSEPCNTLSPRMLHRSEIKHVPQNSYNKERRQQMKRHCRPVLGGAPFVICYNCLELLQVPMDFFIAGKRLCKLQCGACSKVLIYSFRAQNHGIPHMSNEAENTTSEVDSSTDTSLRAEIPNSHFNDRSPWEPVSYSEDYGLSFGISYSTEVEEAAHVRRNSSSMMEKRNARLRTGSQLHRLMGYGSASELLYRHSDIDEESELTEATTPHCNTPDETYVGDGMNGKAICISDPSTSRYY